ncbi:MAG: outer membrane lipoprotein-sorting protein [candidate division Zixibacteria bacterium]|nr:outer membrane lipoprotein-sorting protein [candidate division Zixibacteria bacterium]
MKKFSISLMIVAIVAMFAQGVWAGDAEDLMKKSHMAYYYAGDDGLSKVTMKIINKKGKERIREFTMLRLDITEGGEQKYYTYFKKPSDVSRLTFMVWKNPDANDDRWLYVPAVDLIKRLSADDKNSSFVGSDFSYEDVSGRHWTEDTHTIVSENETVNDRAAFLISSKPKQEKDSFSEKKTWIDKETFLPLKEEYYNDKGKLFRIFTADKIEEIDGIITITQRTMENVKKKQRTTIIFDSIEYNVGMKENIFTERYLKNPPRKYIK